MLQDYLDQGALLNFSFLNSILIAAISFADRYPSDKDLNVPELYRPNNSCPTSLVVQDHLDHGTFLNCYFLNSILTAPTWSADGFPDSFSIRHFLATDRTVFGLIRVDPDRFSFDRDSGFGLTLAESSLFSPPTTKTTDCWNFKWLFESRYKLNVTT